MSGQAFNTPAVVREAGCRWPRSVQNSFQARVRRSDRQESIFNIRGASIDGVAEGQGQPRRGICDWRIHGTERFSPSFWGVTVGRVFGREAPLHRESGNGI